MFSRVTRVLAGALSFAAMVGLFVGPGASASRAESVAAVLARIRQYHNELQDVSASLRITRENNDVLASISPDFAQFVKYGFRNFKFYYKNPDKMRIESTATLFHFIQGIATRSGGVENFYVPALHIHRTSNVAGQANKKQTSMDFGLMAGDVWDDYNIWYIRSETDNGRPTYVLGLQPKNEPNGGSMIARVDVETLRVNERDRYNGAGQLQQREYFLNFVHPLTHVWLPGVVQLYNASGQFGGELTYTSFAVNQGLSNRLFH